MNLLEQFVTDQMQFVNKLGQFVKIARAVVGQWTRGGSDVCTCCVAFAAGVLDQDQAGLPDLEMGRWWCNRLVLFFGT